MGISKLLKKFDIKVIGKVTKEQQIIVSDNAATKISNIFEYIEYGYIYKKLMQIKMYIAVIPKEMTRAIYSYEENTLFISDEEDLNFISKELLYECIHAIQDIKDKDGKTKQLGQCIFTEYKVYAMALNEASIQYIVSKIYEDEIKEVEAYSIKLKTFSPNKYPLICNLLLQLLYTTDEQILVKSTINSNDNFILECVDNLGEGTFKSVQSNLDDMLYASEEILGIKKKIKNGENVKLEKELNKINEKETLIRKLYMDCQMMIFTTYFDKLYNRLETIQEMKKYMNELVNYKKLLGSYLDKNQEYFTQYYEGYYKKREEKLIEKEEMIKIKNDNALTVVSTNPMTTMFNKIKLAISKILKKA